MFLTFLQIAIIITKIASFKSKNYIDRFDEEMCFQLTDTELKNLRCKNCTSSSYSSKDDNLMSKFSTSSWGGTRYLPYAFTEGGMIISPPSTVSFPAPRAGGSRVREVLDRRRRR